jgi:hypothetical protein
MGNRLAVVRWGRFLACLSLMLLGAFVGLPLAQRLGPVREVRQAIHRVDIDAAALFYTENPSFSDAESAVRNRMQFPLTPKNAPQK